MNHGIRPHFAGMALAVASAFFTFPVMAANFQVNNTGDAARDPGAAAGVCLALGGGCTLRAAIQTGNGVTGPHNITFDTSITTIVLTTDLPGITAPIDLNGTNTNAASGNRVEIDGNNSGCLSLSEANTAFNANGARGSTVRNLVIRNCSGDGIALSGHGYTITGNRIGTNAAGTASDPADDGNSGHGISLSGTIAPPVSLPDLSALIDDLPADFGAIAAFSTALQAALAVIAGPNLIADNLISGNANFGIEVFGQNTVNTIITGNIIGLDQSAGSALPNGHGGGNRAGILINSSAYGNFIGPGNIVSGNNSNSTDDGIQIVPGAVRLPNFVMGNLVGLGNNPLAEVGNGDNGIVVTTTPHMDNPTGFSLFLGPANTIADNQSNPGTGLDISGGDTSGGVLITNSSNTRVFGNFIGMFQFPAGGTPIGEIDVGNAGNGIVVTSGNHEIGGSEPGFGNLILGNGRHGILLRGGAGASNVTVRGNFIGVSDPTGLELFDFGNGGDGIQVFGSPVHQIGGFGDDDGNVIAANGRNGIKLSELSTSNTKSVLIARNSIYANGQDGEGIAIDLAGISGESNVANAVDNSVPNTNYPNFRQNAPVLCNNGGALAACAALPPPSLDTGSGMLTASWAVQSSPDTPLRIEFYASDAPCSAGTGEGKDFLFSKNVTTDGAGLYSESAAFMPDGDAQGRCIALTATNLYVLEPGALHGYPTSRLDGTEGPANATSEFSNGVLAQTPGSVAFTPASHNFGMVTVGAQSDFDFNLAHVDGDAVTGITLGASGAGFSVAGSTCGAEPFDLGPGEDCMVTARFAPGVAGAASGQLDANASVGDGDSAALSGTGQAPGMLAFDVPSLDFGGVVTGTSDTLTATLENTGGAPVDNIVIAVSGTGFSRDGGSCDSIAFSLPGGNACTVIVRFQPAATGPASGDLDANGTGASANASLSGTGLAPALLGFDLASYDFGSVEIGSSADLTATLSNSGDVAATNVLVNVSGSGFSREGGSCGMAAFSLPPGDTCDVLLRFTPAAAGAASGNLNASHDAGADADAGLLGTGIEPGALVFDPNMLAFGDVLIGDNEALTTTLENTGGVPVSGIELSVSGAGFSRDGGSCDTGTFMLAAGATCTVTIRFEPVAVGMVSGALDATSTDGGGAAADLTGNGVEAGALAFDPASLDFGNVVVGDSDTLMTTLENTGGVAVTGIQLSVSGAAFSRDGGTCDIGTFTLAAGADCTVIVRFDPAVSGPAAGSLDAASLDGGAASAILAGNGQAPGDLVFSDASIDFGAVVAGGAGVTQTVTLSNPGDIAVENVMIAVTGAGFSRDGGSCDVASFILAAGANCTVIVRFAPALTGPASGSLDASGDGGVSDNVALAGEGIEAGALDFDPAALDFGNVEVGSSATLSTTLENGGGVMVTGIEVAVSGSGFSRDGGTCSSGTFSLAAGASCTVIVRFQPAVAGAAAGSVAATSDSGGANATLAGNGTEPPPPPVTFNPPGGLNFGGVVIGNDATLVIELTNSSGADLTGLVLQVSGDFEIVGENCTPTLGIGMSCQVQIRFTPTATGLRNGLFSLDADGGISASAALSGTGLPLGGVPTPAVIPTLDRLGLPLLALILAGLGLLTLRQRGNP